MKLKQTFSKIILETNVGNIHFPVYITIFYFRKKYLFNMSWIIVNAAVTIWEYNVNSHILFINFTFCYKKVLSDQIQYVDHAFLGIE